jgi:hypothetical protein
MRTGYTATSTQHNSVLGQHKVEAAAPCGILQNRKQPDANKQCLLLLLLLMLAKQVQVICATSVANAGSTWFAVAMVRRLIKHS